MSNYLVKWFQKEACTMALELLRDVYRLPLHRLYFTYFGGDQNLGLSADEECRNIWLELGLVCCENLATSKRLLLSTIQIQLPFSFGSAITPKVFSLTLHKVLEN